MFKKKCKCLNCEHIADGIYFQKNESYNRVRTQITKSMNNALENNSAEAYIWLKELRNNLETYQKYYN